MIIIQDELPISAMTLANHRPPSVLDIPQRYAFRAEPLERRLPGGTIVRWYNWHLV